MEQRSTIGLDLGDSSTHYLIVDPLGVDLEVGKVATTEPGLSSVFTRWSDTQVVMEVGTHSPWVSRLALRCGLRVRVAETTRLELIAKNQRKSDESDARILAELGRTQSKLLKHVRHRGPQAQADLALVRARASLVRARTLLVNHVRGTVKAFGGRVRSCETADFAVIALDDLPAASRPALEPLLKEIATLSANVEVYDRDIKDAIEKRYPVARSLARVHGVGPVTALAFVVTLDDPKRFKHSRDVGPYLGLTPGRAQSGSMDPERRITKAGDRFLRSLLVQGAHSHLRQRKTMACDIEVWAKRRVEQTGKNQRKRILVAVARRMAVLMHRLWVTGEVYDPMRETHARAKAALAARTAAAAATSA